MREHKRATVAISKPLKSTIDCRSLRSIWQTYLQKEIPDTIKCVSSNNLRSIYASYITCTLGIMLRAYPD